MNAWANLHFWGQPNTFLARSPRPQWQAGQVRGRRRRARRDRRRSGHWTTARGRCAPSRARSAARARAERGRRPARGVAKRAAHACCRACPLCPRPSLSRRGHHTRVNQIAAVNGYWVTFYSREAEADARAAAARARAEPVAGHRHDRVRRGPLAILRHPFSCTRNIAMGWAGGATAPPWHDAASSSVFARGGSSTG